MATLDEAGLYHDARSLLESRTAPLGGLLLLAMLALLTAGVGWSAWADVDEIVVADGRVEPRGRVKLVNHARGGLVAEIMVAEGDRVATGDPLLRIDPDLHQGDYAELIGRAQVRSAEVARLSAEAHGTVPAFAPELVQDRPDLVAAETQLLDARALALANRRETMSKAVQTRRGETRMAAAQLARLKSSIVLQRQQLDAVRELAERGLFPRLKLIESERQLADTPGQLAEAEASLSAAQAAQAESEARLAGLEKDWHSELLENLAKATADLSRLVEQRQAQQQLLGSMVVRAPVDGIVQDLRIAGPGQSVGANDILMRLVPVNEGLVVETRVANADIGRLSVGLAATLKVRTYDYLRHGTLAGAIVKIAADATPEPRTGELSYLVTVAAERDRLGGAPGELELGPGMLVDVELHVGSRTILSYLTDRIMRLQQEAFRQG